PAAAHLRRAAGVRRGHETRARDTDRPATIHRARADRARGHRPRPRWEPRRDGPLRRREGIHPPGAHQPRGYRRRTRLGTRGRPGCPRVCSSGRPPGDCSRAAEGRSPSHHAVGAGDAAGGEPSRPPGGVPHRIQPPLGGVRGAHLAGGRDASDGAPADGCLARAPRREPARRGGGRGHGTRLGSWPRPPHAARPCDDDRAGFEAHRAVGAFCRGLALAALGRSPRRTALTVATLGVGFAVVTWLWVVANSVEQSVMHVMPGIFRADLVVGSVRISGGYVEAPLDEGVLREIEQVPGVAVVVVEHSSDWHYAGGPIAINAVDTRFFLDPRFERWPLVGPAVPDVWRLMAAGEVAIVSTNLSHNLGIALGDVLDLDTPSGPLRLRVGGMVDDFLSPRGTVLMSRELYVRHWHDTQIT